LSSSTGERAEPQVNVVHQPPKPQPPYWRIPEAAKAKLAEAQADAEKARREIEAIEDHFKS
jgi:hypothetical protein